jgi:nucleotide-binding universal stress UspA family protein
VTPVPRCIAAPVTLGPDSAQVVSTAAALADALGAELVLAGIAPLAVPARAAAQVENGNWLDAGNQQRFLDLLVRERLDELSSELPVGLRVRTVLTWGPPGHALVQAAHEESAELIVVAMRRESALGHAIHDHDDRHVVHHSDVPVLVVPTSPARRR